VHVKNSARSYRTALESAGHGARHERRGETGEMEMHSHQQNNGLLKADRIEPEARSD